GGSRAASGRARRGAAGRRDPLASVRHGSDVHRSGRRPCSRHARGAAAGALDSVRSPVGRARSLTFPPYTPGSMPAGPDTVVVLDFGSQYTQVIARRVREARVRAIVLPFDAPAAELRALEPKGIILSGGPSSVYDADAPKGDPGLFELKKPVLGLCYGMMWIAQKYGGRVGSAPGREYG